MGLFSRVSGLSYEEEPVEADVLLLDKEEEQKQEPEPFNSNVYWVVDAYLDGGRSLTLLFGREAAYAEMEEEALACADDIMNSYYSNGWVSSDRKTHINRSKITHVTVSSRARR